MGGAMGEWTFRSCRAVAVGDGVARQLATNEQRREKEAARRTHLTRAVPAWLLLLLALPGGARADAAPEGSAHAPDRGHPAQQLVSIGISGSHLRHRADALLAAVECPSSAPRNAPLPYPWHSPDLHSCGEFAVRSPVGSVAGEGEARIQRVAAPGLNPETSDGRDGAKGATHELIAGVKDPALVILSAFLGLVIIGRRR